MLRGVSDHELFLSFFILFSLSFNYQYIQFCSYDQSYSIFVAKSILPLPTGTRQIFIWSEVDKGTGHFMDDRNSFKMLWKYFFSYCQIARARHLIVLILRYFLCIATIHFIHSLSPGAAAVAKFKVGQLKGRTKHAQRLGNFSFKNTWGSARHSPSIKD